MSNKSSISIPASGRERLRRRGDARRLEILRAAGRIFRQRGYSQAGMRDIAAAADISSGNLYHYFRGKHEILYFCQDRTLDTMLQALASTRGNGGSALERLREVLTAHVHTILDDVEGTAAHLEVDALPADLRVTIIRKRDRYESGLRRLVGEVISEERLPRRDPRIITRAMLGALNWTVRWYRPQGPASVKTVARDLMDFLMGGLTAPGNDGAAGPADSKGGRR
jgi:AcrR family transcriptional regulator